MEIFNTLVGHIEGGQPVGSKTLSQMMALDLSPASIRSNMSDLEEAGLLFAPHTSAGRIPTETGLRLFVDGLMEFNPDIPEKERLSIDGECAARGISINELLDKTSKALSDCPDVPAWCCHQQAMPSCSISSLCQLAEAPLLFWCALTDRSKTDH